MFATIFGHMALNQIRRTGGYEQGRGLAIAGLAFGYFGIGTLLLFAIAAALS